MMEPRILWSYRPGTSFFVSQTKKSLPKTTTKKLYLAKKVRNRDKEQCMKNKRLSGYIYSLATLQCKVCLMCTKAGQFIKSYKIM